MLLASEMRGIDASGIGYVYNNNVYAVKHELEGRLLLSSMDKTLLDYVLRSNAVVAHTRQGTGGTGEKNAHPFVVNSRCLYVHNGILSNAVAKNSEGIVCDSYALKQTMDALHTNTDSYDSISKAVQRMSGTYAFSILTPQYTDIFRGTNPIVYALCNGGIVYASTDDILTAGLASILSYGQELPTVHVLKAGNSLHINNYKGKVVKKEFPYVDITTKYNSYTLKKSDNYTSLYSYNYDSYRDEFDTPTTNNRKPDYYDLIDCMDELREYVYNTKIQGLSDNEIVNAIINYDYDTFIKYEGTEI
jgi:glucosamine 6-phosphate synthetase-like amidotransferase/phosphosugar isomerase protein